MKRFQTSLIAMAIVAIAGFQSYGQQICDDGSCGVGVHATSITLNKLQEEVSVDEGSITELASVDRFAHTILATVRCTVSGVCGSGTVVGRDGDGNAIVLTNAHVAGTQRGRVINVERWNLDGSSEKSTGSIIAAGYGKGMSIDFALLKCKPEFAKGVAPVPLANRFPSAGGFITTYGCPRCEWPSLQVLRMNRRESQVLSWKPEAIGGRSGSSVVEHTEAGPRVVGLLTWGGGGEGLGQSAPFLLEAMKGRLPKSLEALPPGVKELSPEVSPLQPLIMTYPVREMASTEDLDNTSIDNSLLDQITEKEPTPDVAPKQPEEGRVINRPIINRPVVLPPREVDPPKAGPLGQWWDWFTSRLLVGFLMVGAFAIGYFVRSIR